MTALERRLEEYLAVRRALGYKLERAGKLLALFLRLARPARRGGDHDRVGFGVGDAAAGYGLQLAPPTAFGGPGFRGAPARDRSSP